MIVGLLAAVLGIMFSLINSQLGLVSKTFNWPVSIICIGISLIGYKLYRCPVCGKEPENSDFFMFNPSKCVNCGCKLR